MKHKRMPDEGKILPDSVKKNGIRRELPLIRFALLTSFPRRGKP